jgi:hypothetical protein
VKARLTQLLNEDKDFQEEDVLKFNYEYFMGIFEFIVGNVTIPTKVIKLSRTNVAPGGSAN